MTYKIIKYQPEYQSVWDDFITRSANGTFLHKRDYMDYHAHRFKDFSLMVFDEKNLKAVLPAHQRANDIYAHKGLTYSDFIFLPGTRTAQRRDMLQQALAYLNQAGFQKLLLQNIPFVFHTHPNDINTYLYFQLRAKIYQIKPFFIIPGDDFRLNKDRKNNLKKLHEKDYEILDSIDYLLEFWHIVQKNLQEKHQSKPVHSFEEISLLASRFPVNIRLFTLHQKGVVTSGALLYVFPHTLHFQYIHSDPQVKNPGVDNLIAYVVEKYKNEYKYISLGTSEKGNNLLSKGLAYWKESFGAVIFNQFFFEISLENHYVLNNLLQ